MNTQNAALAAAIISAISIIVQIGLAIYNNSQIKKLEQKKIDADIISKSRMEWINKARSLTAEFLNDSTFIIALINMYCKKSVEGAEYVNEIIRLDSLKPTSDTLEQIKQYEKLTSITDQQQSVNLNTLNELQEKMYRERILIKLQFSNNTDNNVIVGKVENITDDLRKFSHLIGLVQLENIDEKKCLEIKAEKLRETTQKEIEELVEILRDYFKKEWEKVKKGE